MSRRVTSKYDVVILKNLIEHAKTQYKCNRGPRPSGASFVSELSSVGNRQVVYGHVQPTHNASSCLEIGCMVEDGHCVRNNHAEVAALLNCACDGISTYNGTIYSINKPCYNCTKACIAAGISTIIYAYVVYDEDRTKDIIDAAGVECIHVPIE